MLLRERNMGNVKMQLGKFAVRRTHSKSKDVALVNATLQKINMVKYIAHKPFPRL